MTGTKTPTAALALALRPAESGAESGDCETNTVDVLEEEEEEAERKGPREIAPKPVGTATLTTFVAAASAKCTANEPFSPQVPQSGTLR